jgi:murein DD-endopeptidase MepM/ murein hydrolase activator NlpD
VLNVGFIRATVVALAATLFLAVPGEGRAQPKKEKRPEAASTATSGKTGSKAGKSAKSAKSSKSDKTAHSSRKLHGGPQPARAVKKRPAKRVIRQDAENQVVLEWIQTARPKEFFGPFLPPAEEAFDFPPAPCSAEDVVLTAELHDENPDTPEAEASDDAMGEDDVVETTRTERLVAVAKRMASLLRPKSPSARMTAEDVDLAELLQANLRIPVEGVDAEKLRDSFLDRRGKYRKHLAIDIGAPRGTPVLATADGEIIRLRREKRGGITIYQKDPTGKYLFFYCHLSRYVKGLAVGQKVSAGEPIGYVGATGHVIGGAHLHFSITRVPEDDDFREGLAVNPYLLFLAGVP